MVVKEGYKQTELGDIPNDWIVTTFENVLDGFSSGMTPYRGNPEYYTGNIKWITSGELNYNVIFDTIEKITDEAVKKTSLKILPIGTFLMAITGLEAAGTRGSCGIVGVKATTNQSCMALYPTTKLSTDYLYQFYVKYGNYLAFNYCQGTKQQSYTAKIVKQLPIILPSSPEEQKAIAKALSDVDALIASLEQLITKKQLIKQGAMQELLTGKRRLPGFEVKKGYKQTEIGEIPEDWEIKSIGSIATVVGGGTPSTSVSNYWNGDINWFTPTEIGRDKYVSYSKRKLSEDGLQSSSSQLLPVGTILLTSRAGIGSLAILTLEACTNQGFQSLIANENINNEYVYYLMGTLKNVLLANASGSTFLEITPTKVKSINIALPSKQEQEAIATILSDMDTELEALETKLEKTKQIKEGTMHELLTGRIRLI